jgi:hypothetical protein
MQQKGKREHETSNSQILESNEKILEDNKCKEEVLQSPKASEIEDPELFDEQTLQFTSQKKKVV